MKIAAYRKYLKKMGFKGQKDVKDEHFEEIKKKSDPIKGIKIFKKKF